jgi:radical SAM/Cys-rich protein
MIMGILLSIPIFFKHVMNTFEQKLKEQWSYPLKAKDISTFQVNLGYKCNLRCNHCHVKAAPDRNELMSLKTMARILDILKDTYEIKTVDITGGSPELNPYFKYMVRSNLAIYTEKGMEDIPEYLAENKIKIIASLPCYSEEGVDSQRGKGTYMRAITALKKLNSLGYGKEGSNLEIDIMFNPAGADIAPDQVMLENAYRENLMQMHGATFNHLIALSNMPIGRLRDSLTDEQLNEYMSLLEEKFNPDTVKNLMCRHLISVSPDGRLFDCDFWQMLDIPVKNGRPKIEDFDYDSMKNREIVTLKLCLLCTAGTGASCSGALT